VFDDRQSEQVIVIWSGGGRNQRAARQKKPKQKKTANKQTWAPDNKFKTLLNPDDITVLAAVGESPTKNTKQLLALSCPFTFS
jgi:hypothetical protein